MNDYLPLDLTDEYNAGPEWFIRGQKFPDESWFPPSDRPPVGTQQFRGLPFQIGSERTNHCLILFGPGGLSRSVEIRLGCRAKWLVVAHRLLESRLFSGGPLGELVATYRFHFADGRIVEQPIRERFEISLVTPRWGQLPFLAESDQREAIADPDKGPWERTGWRQTEVSGAWPRWFVLWPWQNPYPESEICSLVVEPAGPPFFIAAITTSSLEEDPFGTGSRHTVRIDRKDSTGVNASLPLSVEVDRGAANLVSPLPQQPAASYLEDPLRGWGDPAQSHSSPAYVHLTAQPSATLTLFQGEQPIDVYPWGRVLEQGQAETSQSRIEIIDHELNWVHTRVVDADTGHPIPCRINFRSSSGVPYAPHGHHDHLLSDKSTWHIDVGGDVRLGQNVYAYIDGTCQGWLPQGEVLVDAARGFEYEPVRVRTTIQSGQRELTIPIRRWADWSADGWYSGDTHVHFLSTFGALLEAQGEDLNVVNLLQSQWGHLFTNTEEFIGRPVATPDGRTAVYTSQENRQHMLGHMSLLGLKQPVMPWCSDGPSEAEFGGTLETTLSHWADACHAQGGTVVMPHFPEPNGEAAALIATGRVDAVEMIAHDPYNHGEYYRYLNGGYRLPLVGGTDKMSSEVPVGLYRTYVHIPADEPFSYENWVKHLELGHTFLSSGPLIRMSVDGQSVGDTLHLSGNGGTVEVSTSVESIFPVHSLQIIQEGRVVAETANPQGSRRLTLSAQVPVRSDTWLAARAGGPGYTQAIAHRDELGRGIMAHTSPIYITVRNEWRMHSPETAQYMLTLLHGGLEYIQRRSQHAPAGSRMHHHGEADHHAYLERPFREAIAAVEASSLGTQTRK